MIQKEICFTASLFFHYRVQAYKKSREKFLRQYAKYSRVLFRQYRIILVRGLRSQIFRQNVQIISVHTDVWILIFGQSDGIICKQGVRHELCGVAFILCLLAY